MQVRGTFPELNAGRTMNHNSKIHKVMREFKIGTLHSGSKKGPKVKNRKQAIAIALSEAREAADGRQSSFALPRKPKEFSQHNPKSIQARRALSRRLSKGR